MKSKLHRLAVIMMAAFGLFSLSGCQTDWYSKTSLALAKNPQGATGDLLRGVDELYHAIMMATNAIEIRRGSEIPRSYWSPPIKALHPIKVYEDIGNIVIVQKIANGMEYGKYIMPTYSSHWPESDFILTSIGVSFVSDYRKIQTRQIR
ncbi:MAG: hypothetical protein JWR69_3382 [Pedosphaera sp.]|nr:hypothetical protein [Pedosphaera sp.]